MKFTDSRIFQIALGFLVPILLLGAWQYASVTGYAAPNLLPPLTRIYGTFTDLLASGELGDHLFITLYRVFAGFVAGLAVALVLGILNGYFRFFRYLFDPMLQALRNIPSMAWVPLFILWLGIYETSKITLIAIGVFFPVYLNLLTGIINVDRKLIEVGWVHGYKGFRLIWHFFLPATLPSLVVGMRSGLSMGWMFVVAAEIMGASKGLGFLMTDGQTTGRPAIIMTSLILFAIFGKLTDMGMVWIGSKLLYWQTDFGTGNDKARNG
ncbi:ABC transporter permease [Paenibacillus sp. FSL A5-0031]|uniref:ABC transporter permease n=1 Tax=Paenibacillus sp. FSL A5-0031 TaxID=1920420 RepID=UPI00096FC10A|nr:ABC transporter permease [Paenibacillus sp. FSL A5-0031]OME85178.1 ABC transporter permease [Paenibacillus sp. FSL A5-0031]